MKSRWLGLLLVFFPACCAWAEDAGVAIAEPAALRSFVVGNTLYGATSMEGEGAYKWSEYHCSNGRSIYVRGLEVFRGTWWLEGNEVCYAYDEIDPGEQFCFQVVPRGDGSYDMVGRNAPDGTKVTVLGQLAGDPFKIQQLKRGTCGDLSS